MLTFYRGLIGASVSQFKSKVLNIDLALFKRLRNSEDRYVRVGTIRRLVVHILILTENQ